MWECKKCGSCCAVAGLIIKDWDRGDGVCKNLTQDNLCAIYEDRPAICNTKNFNFTDEDRLWACSQLRKRREINE